MPKVSIITPVFNTEKYLPKCIDSLIHQTLEDIEIIIIDDGSTDKSGQIADYYYKKYPDKIKLVHKPNGGQASARNLGIQLSTGEYIGFLDSDDFVKNTMFEMLYNNAKQNSSDFVSCGYTDLKINKNDKTIVLKKYVANRPCTTNSEMFFNALVCPFISFYRGDLLRNSGVTFPEGLIFEDTAFWINIIPFIHKLSCIEQSLAYRVRRESSTTTTYSLTRIRNIFRIVENITTFYKTHDFWNDYHMQVEYFCVRILLCSSVQRIAHLSSRKERSILINETLLFIYSHFPDYRENQYFSHGIRNIYIRYCNKWILKLLVSFFHIKNCLKESYV